MRPSPAPSVETDEAADEVRRRLRPVLIRQLDDELADTSMLVDAFRGKLDV